MAKKYLSYARKFCRQIVSNRSHAGGADEGARTVGPGENYAWSYTRETLRPRSVRLEMRLHHGWKVLDRCEAKIIRGKGAKELPIPMPRGGIRDLWDFVNMNQHLRYSLDRLWVSTTHSAIIPPRSIVGLQDQQK
jgi:hypothetical protein